MKRYLKIKNKLLKALAICLLMPAAIGSSVAAFSQEYIEIQPLFEYPTAPEELSSLNEKSDYLVEHFWDDMDFKGKKTVDQTALNHAFKVYATPLRYADKNKATVAIDKLLETLQKNPTLLLQFTKAAEENIYGPRAEAWIDEIYIKFLQALLKNKKIQQPRKEKYRKQLAILENCAVGQKAPSFSFENVKGGESKYFPMTTPSILIFGDPANADWRIARLRMETNAALKQAVDKGKINILFLLPEEKAGWKDEVSNYPQNWVTGCGNSLQEQLDLRSYPNIYFASVWFVGSDGKLEMKNVNLESAIARALESVNQ